MKHYNIILALLLLTGIVSCDNDSFDSEVLSDGDLIPVNINVGIENDLSPLTRSFSSSDLLGIQVDVVNSEGNVSSHYAHGLFNATNAVSLYLPKGSTYKITATIVKNGQNILFKNQFSDYGIGSIDYNQSIKIDWRYEIPYKASSDPQTNTYWTSGPLYPFMLYGGYKSKFYFFGPVRILNRFNYRSNYYYSTYNINLNYHFIGLNDSRVSLADKSEAESNYPAVGRLYGEVNNFKPTAENCAVNLKMKYVSFKVNFSASGLEEGSLEVSLGNNSKTLLAATGLTNGSTTSTREYTFNNLMTVYANENYSEMFTITVKHKHAVTNYLEDLGSADIRLYRGKLNNIRFNLQTIITRAKEKTQSPVPLSELISVEYDNISEQ